MLRPIFFFPFAEVPLSAELASDNFLSFLEEDGNEGFFFFLSRCPMKRCSVSLFSCFFWWWLCFGVLFVVKARMKIFSPIGSKTKNVRSRVPFFSPLASRSKNLSPSSPPGEGYRFFHLRQDGQFICFFIFL